MAISKHLIGQLVLVRTVNAGVHIGKLAEREGSSLRLTEARRLWSWAGARTLSEAATRGVAMTGSRLSEPSEVTLLGAIEIHPVTEEATKSLTESRWS